MTNSNNPYLTIREKTRHGQHRWKSPKKPRRRWTFQFRNGNRLNRHSSPHPRNMGLHIQTLA